MSIFNGRYKFFSNTPDIYDLNLPLERCKAVGGTMAMWKSSIDQYVTVLETSSSSVLPILLKLPSTDPSCHIGIYLPTAGKEDQFISALSDLDSTVALVKEQYGDRTNIFVRGDMNVSSKNLLRYPLLCCFMEKFNLKRADVFHYTYHHFTGFEGEFDSDLDLILYQDSQGVSENLTNQVCKHDDPLIESHHDLLISQLLLPKVKQSTHFPVHHQAPKIPNNRVKIIWSEEGIKSYENLLNTHLDDLASRWSNVNSTSSISILLSATNEILHLAATKTNDFIELSRPGKQKPKLNPELLKLRNKVLHLHRQRSQLPNDCTISDRQRIQDELAAARSVYKKSLREARQSDEDTRDSQLSSFPSNPSTIFKSLRQSKNVASNSLSQLRVGDMVFDSKSIGDGFHKSLSMLKAPDMTKIESSASFNYTLRDFDHIMKLVESSAEVPPISIHEAIDILYSVRSDVNDLHSITAAHFIHAGSAGLRHFYLLLSSFISNINNSSIQELNDVWAIVLYKGHKKDKESDRSYRTISTCPLITKCLDIYIGRRFYQKWRLIQSPRQFQGECSSHELASLLLTETIQHSIYHAKRPIFVIFLDAKSAFDVVVRQNAIVNAYKAGTDDKSLIYFNNRLAGRRTFVEWDKKLLGPIYDKRGLEQGAVNSDRIYKLGNNSQLKEAQQSNLGVDVEGVMVAAIGQADDVALVSSSPEKLACLLYLTSIHCMREHVDLVPEKTKLLVWTPSRQKVDTILLKLSCKIEINGNPIDYTTAAEHVGILRTTEGGNMPHILDRISAHKRAIASVLHAGMARKHKAKPSSSLQLEKIYGSSVLFSGVGSLVLNEKELKALSNHFKLTVSRLQKLPLNTPECVIFFLSGNLPATAIVHLRMLSLLGMISRLGTASILQQIGRKTLLSSRPNKRS